MVLRETPDFSASAAGIPLIIAQHPANPVGRTTVISFDTQLCRVICAVGFFYDLNEKFQAAFAGKVLLCQGNKKFFLTKAELDSII